MKGQGGRLAIAHNATLRCLLAGAHVWPAREVAQVEVDSVLSTAQFSFHVFLMGRQTRYALSLSIGQGFCTDDLCQYGTSRWTDVRYSHVVELEHVSRSERPQNAHFGIDMFRTEVLWVWRR